MKPEIKKQTDGTIEITVTVPKKIVDQFYGQALEKLTKEAEVKGFRKGKAPKNLVEKNLGKQRVYQEAIEKIVSQAYVEAIKQNNLKPVTAPKVELLSAKDGQDWQIKITTAERPSIDLGKWKEEVRKELATEKIWVPGKEKDLSAEEQGNQTKNQNQKLEKIFVVLLRCAQVKLPPSLVEEEVNRMLSRLIDQTSKLGLTVDQYLTSIGKTNEVLKQEYAIQAEKTLKLEFILDEIANQEKIQIKDEEIEAIIAKIPDEKTKKALQTDEQKGYLRQLNRKQQVIDRLLAL